MSETAHIRGIVREKEDRLSKAKKKFVYLRLDAETGPYFIHNWNTAITEVISVGDGIDATCSVRIKEGRRFYNMVSLIKLTALEVATIEKRLAINQPLDTSEQTQPPAEMVGPGPQQAASPVVNKRQATPTNHFLTKDQSIVRQVMFKCAAWVMQGKPCEKSTFIKMAFDMEKAFYAGPSSA